MIAAKIQQSQRPPIQFTDFVAQDAAFLELRQYQIDLHGTQIELIVRRKGMSLDKKKC